MSNILDLPYTTPHRTPRTPRTYTVISLQVRYATPRGRFAVKSYALKPETEHRHER